VLDVKQIVLNRTSHERLGLAETVAAAEKICDSRKRYRVGANTI
jgi:hypothetical protein